MSKLAINGFGRIGRLVFRIMIEKGGFDIGLINDLTDTKTLAHLLKYDSVHGRFKGEVSYDDNNIIVNGKKIRVTAEKDPENLPYKDLGIKYVIESTGVWTKSTELEKHIKAGAEKVILTAPAKDDVKTIVVGVNDKDILPTDKILSNASCTTNCIAPIVKILDEAFGIEQGWLNTIHAYTNDQRVLDLPHKDLRRARTAAANIIPTSTGAAKAVALVYPKMKGKLDGVATRVPVTDGSASDFVFITNSEVTKEKINETIKKAAEGAYKGIVYYTEDPIVSSDIVGTTYSCIFDAEQTKVMGKMVRILAWYDNEFGYSNRVVDLAQNFFK
ncbi:MAG: type I glyceraldehyde-3-phosphate dehydrogenase [Spirochaetes bacterium]|nr:type I glyceraldehyde-3-phosphate dehydrogenase [Spirochaetota bacterium]